MTEMPADRPRILVAGATGYVGGRLIPLLAERGFRVRAMSRRPEALAFVASELVESVRGDVLEPETLGPALEGVHTAYYLIHAMGSKQGFAEEEADGARNFAKAATAAGVQRIIYLGALGSDQTAASAHLRSRAEVGEILRQAEGVEVVEFRASVIIGAGSLSFELVRHLTERLPLMVTPVWVSMPAQPIHILDMLAYLVAAAEQAPMESRIYDVGCPDRVSYADLIRIYADLRGLKRVLLRLPVLTPYLSSLWLGLVTPVFSRIGRKLVEGMQTATVITNDRASRDFDITPIGARAAMKRVLNDEDERVATTHWADAVSATGGKRRYPAHRLGNRILDRRECRVATTPDQAFSPIQRIGGKSGWYWGNWLWVLRGWMDLLVGGVGLRRGRRDQQELRIGTVVDCWRVADYEPGRRLLLEAEMHMPGHGWLEFEVHPDPDDPNACQLVQTAIFDPLGLTGLVYWYGIYPIHAAVFRGMLRGIARRAEQLAAEDPDASKGD